MHVEKIVQQLLSSSIHKTRIKTLIVLLYGLIRSKLLRLTLLGRHLDTEGTERSAILRVNRFLGNLFYQQNASQIYGAMTRYVIGNKMRPDIIVDWSSLPNSHYTTEGGEHCILRASLAAEGRSITLYEEVHSKKKESNPKVHQGFLNGLQSILPENCRPCIITDAGFKNPWFKAVAALDWDYLGRVACGSVHFDNGEGFQSVKHLFEQASTTPKRLGTFVLSKTNALKTTFYVYKEKSKGRHKFTRTSPKKIATDKDSKKHGKAYREPWVLVSSLEEGYNIAQKVIKKFKSRMTIEESFRDTKSVEYGFSMNENKTIKPQRYIVWLMLAALASLIAWIVGYAGEQQQLQYHFQANTYRHRRVLSFFYLGCQMIKKKIPCLIDIESIPLLAWGESTLD
jgi:hypothetical protein